ncbi:MAG: hypothetical protein JWO36_2984 [Myxococcales bacterium]|nr:hypothetical protein [Myxococcales bacterium]
MVVLKPPTLLEIDPSARVVFLAGSIEMGNATEWQAALTRELAHLNVVVLNPRRDEWDATWRQSIDEPKFRAQVEWELDGLDRADLIAMWFVPETASPITLLELGLHARDGKLVVGCPPGYWRKGNVDIVCTRLGAPLFEAWDPFVAAVVDRLR